MRKKTKPRIFFYNPTCEIAIANGTVSFMPNKTLSQFERDLDVLPMYFAGRKDLVLVNQVPNKAFLFSLQDKGIVTPEFKLLEASLQDSEFAKQPKESLEPWGWSPRIHHIFKNLKGNCDKEFLNRPNAFWHDNHRELYSRKKALEVLHVFLKNQDSKQYISLAQTAKICKSVSEIEKLITGWKQIVIKAPWSSSGRGLQVLRQTCLNKSIVQWINGNLDSQKYLMVEPLLNKKFDFSLQYHISSKGEIQFLGNGFFSTNSNGQYESNLLGGMSTEMREFLSQDMLLDLSDGIAKALIQSEINTNYCGYLGVDCMLFEDETGCIKIQPCLEINLRYNMGTLAIFLDRYLHPSTKGIFKIHFQPQSTFDEFNREMIVKHPFVMKDGKWYRGYLPLTSPDQQKIFGAYVLLKV